MIWNKEFFGYLHSNILTAESAILLQSLLDNNPSISIQEELYEAKCNLQNLFQAEEVNWKQKSRIKWLNDGNRNTKFLHLAAKIGSTKNCIDKISCKGESLENFSKIKEAAIEFFSNS